MKRTPLKRSQKPIRRLRKDKGGLRITADNLWKMACVKEWGNNCEIDGAPATEVHHFFGKNQYARLRHEISNGVPICRACHFKHHFRGDPVIHQAIVEKRGRKWYNKLAKLSKEKAISTNTVGWYLRNIEQLKNYLENGKSTNNN